MGDVGPRLTRILDPGVGVEVATAKVVLDVQLIRANADLEPHVRTGQPMHGVLNDRSRQAPSVGDVPARRRPAKCAPDQGFATNDAYPRCRSFSGRTQQGNARKESCRSSEPDERERRADGGSKEPGQKQEGALADRKLSERIQSGENSHTTARISCHLDVEEATIVFRCGR